MPGRAQSKNPKTGDYTKRKETPGSPKKGEFMDVKKDGKPFKGVAKEVNGSGINFPQFEHSLIPSD